MIKRYDLELIDPYGYGEASHMVQQDDGDWVDHDDHLAALREQREGIAKMAYNELKSIGYVCAAKNIQVRILAFEPGKERSG